MVTWADYTGVLDGTGATIVVNIPMDEDSYALYARVVELKKRRTDYRTGRGNPARDRLDIARPIWHSFHMRRQRYIAFQ